MRAVCVRDSEELADSPELLRAITSAPDNPDIALGENRSFPMLNQARVNVKVKPKKK
jgi:hypothetical protein